MNRKTQKHADDKAMSSVNRDERGLKATSCRIRWVNGNKRNSVLFFFSLNARCRKALELFVHCKSFHVISVR